MTENQPKWETEKSVELKNFIHCVRKWEEEWRELRRGYFVLLTFPWKMNLRIKNL